MKETTELEEMLSFLSGATAARRASSPPSRRAFRSDSFNAVLAEGTANSSPGTSAIRASTCGCRGRCRRPSRMRSAPIRTRSWKARRSVRSTSGRCIRAAVPCSIAVERALGVGPAALSASRDVLRSFGNMSSANVVFVLAALLSTAPRRKRVRDVVRPGPRCGDDELRIIA